MSEEQPIDMSSHFNELIEQIMKSGATLSEAAQMARDQESHERQMRALEREETRKAQLEQDRQTAELAKQEQDRIARLEIEKEK